MLWLLISCVLSKDRYHSASILFGSHPHYLVWKDFLIPLSFPIFLSTNIADFFSEFIFVIIVEFVPFWLIFVNSQVFTSTCFNSFQSRYIFSWVYFSLNQHVIWSKMNFEINIFFLFWNIFLQREAYNGFIASVNESLITAKLLNLTLMRRFYEDAC